jgi:hypothetical protein
MTVPEDDLLLRARTSDPETSHQAMAAYDREKMKGAVACVIQLFRTHGPMADYQLRHAFAQAWPHPCCDHLYQQARSIARDQGRVRDTGARVRNPETHRQQIVWEACHQPPVDIQLCPTCGHVLRRKESVSA